MSGKHLANGIGFHGANKMPVALINFANEPHVGTTEINSNGGLHDRPELMAALDYARDGDTIVVWKLDRLARSLKQLIETVEHLERRGIGFKSITETIDTATPGGKLVFTIFAGLAEFERSIIQERTRAGLEAARSRGRVGGETKIGF